VTRVRPGHVDYELHECAEAFEAGEAPRWAGRAEQLTAGSSAGPLRAVGFSWVLPHQSAMKAADSP
jgi:hypothetical protein